jgi:histone-lysine N-methyltransferase SETMAR
MIASKTAMITIFFAGNRLAGLVHLPQGQKYNKEYFINEILEEINRGLNGGAGTRTTKILKIDMDNCRVHNALDTADKLRSMKLTRLPHPPYSLDLSPCDFWFSGEPRSHCRIKVLLTLMNFSRP